LATYVSLLHRVNWHYDDEQHREHYIKQFSWNGEKTTRHLAICPTLQTAHH